MRKKTNRRWLAPAVIAAAALTSGCVGSVDADELPGVYRDSKTGAELRLDADGMFAATDVSANGLSDPADFSGRWEFHDSQASSDFIYLSVDAGELDKVGGIQLYPKGSDSVYFQADVDGPPTLVLTKATAS
ncbi:MULTISPECIES: hypothetical protein [unclassified Streptomyces]|uniref:hypothetical protein n=1 Tax=unclassified Streptomyces TaxID=2593676 RepID=UPI00278C5ADB|nr:MULTISPECIES: hypothetical protein [unclassified Streptomyces]